MLVCDLGGGTSDFSLIRVSDFSGNLELERIAVGNHILIGGDNMDLALAHRAEQRIVQGGRKLSAASADLSIRTASCSMAPRVPS